MINRKNIFKIERGRNRYVDQSGTPPFIFLNTGDIAVDTNRGGWIVDFENEAKTIRYHPFDFLSINNASGSGLNIFINQRGEWQKTVRAGTIIDIKDFDGIKNIRISKRDSTVTIVAGEVEVTVLRESLSQDERVRRRAKNPIISGLLNKLFEV